MNSPAMNTIHNNNTESVNHASVIYINPPMARRILEKNTRNRPLLELHITRLMAEMQSGRWRYNGEAIKWSNQNELLDGQHRLTALSRLDDSISIPFLVVRGLPSESQDTMDQGRTRTAADQLFIDDLGYGVSTKTLAAAIRCYVQWQEGRLFVNQNWGKVSNPEVIEWAKNNPIECSVMAQISIDKVKKLKARPSLILAILTKFHLIDGQAGREFSESLFSGANLNTGNPIFTLRERLIAMDQKKLKASDKDIIAFFVIAWNAYREGRSMVKFQRPPGAQWSVSNFPEPI